jgi:hypothetical protein
MEYNEFLGLLETHGRGKFHIDDDAIRHAETGECPICFLCVILFQRHFDNYNYPSAAALMGLSQSARNYIADSADYETAKIAGRRDMLRALGLDYTEEIRRA